MSREETNGSDCKPPAHGKSSVAHAGHEPAIRERGGSKATVRGSIESIGQGEQVKKPTINPHPPTQRKAILVKNVEFDKIDRHAIHVAGEHYKTYQTLVGALTGHLRTDLEKVRSLFKWLTSKDLEDVEEDDEGLQEQSPMNTLRNIRIGSESYHHMFMKLCMWAGVHCVTVHGFSKGAGYQPGMSFDGTEFSNTWSAVLIDKDWRLVDCQWSARHVVAGAGTKRDMTYVKDEHYFLTDPDQFIYSHWAKNPDWQLLKKSYSLEDFINLPIAKSLFFKLGMKFRSHPNAIIKVESKIETIKLDIRPDNVDKVEIKFLLTKEGEGQSDPKDGKQFEIYVLQQKHKDHVSFGIRLPASVGLPYHFEVFGKESATIAALNNPTFSCLCKYKIVHENKRLTGEPYPKCAQGEWGPGADCKRHGVVALTHERGTILPSNGQVEIKFLMLKQLQFVAKLVRNDVPSSALTPCVMHRTVGKHVYFSVNFPNVGEYGLDIYAREENSFETLFSQMCKYFINNPKVNPERIDFPLIPNGHWGEKHGFKELELSAKSHEDPLIDLDKEDTVTIKFGITKDVSMTCDFGFSNNETSDMDANFTFVQRTEKEFHMLFRPRDIGFYRIHVYAKEAGDPIEQLPNVFNYLLRNRHKKFTSHTFPLAYSMWNKCYLTCPMSGQLMAKEVVGFKLSVSGAVDVAVIMGEEWTYLTKSGDQWCGDVFINPLCHNVKVAACFNKAAANFDTLLNYDVFKDT